MRRYRLIAVTLLSKLQDYDGIEEVPKEFTPHRLISTLEATPNSGGIIQMKQQLETDIYVNKMRFGDNNKKKFQYRREVQCRMCKGFGHDIDEDVCRIGAQQYHCNQFMETDKDKAKENATAYAVANNKNQVKMLETNFPQLYAETRTEDEKDNVTLSLAKAMITNSKME